MSESNLRGSNLEGTNLSEADLRGTVLTNANYDDETQWPDDFDSVTAGAKKIGPNENL